MTKKSKNPGYQIICLMLMVSLLTLAALPANAGEAADAAENRVLIVYFAVAENSEVDAVSSASVLTENGESRGLIRVLADYFIHDNIGGDFFSIETSVAYPADIGKLIEYASGEQAESARPELISQIEDLSAYDTVFIGYPNWWYDLPMVMYSFFDAYDFSGKTIIPFCTHNGSRFSSTIQTIAALEPDATVITEGFTISQNNAKDANDAVKSWLGEIGF